MTGEPAPPAHLFATDLEEHLPLRPRWLCDRCGHPWPCTQAKIALLADYGDSPINLSLYLASCLQEALDELHRLDPTVTGSAADMFDRFLGWPARLSRCYRVTRGHGRN